MAPAAAAAAAPNWEVCWPSWSPVQEGGGGRMFSEGRMLCNHCQWHSTSEMRPIRSIEGRLVPRKLAAKIAAPLHAAEAPRPCGPLPLSHDCMGRAWS